MNLDYLANLAEISSGIIVVVTLIFLVLQLRDNTNALRNNAVDTLYDGYLEITADTNRIPDLARAMQKAFANEAMDGVETNHFVIYLQRSLSLIERYLVMRKAGRIDQDYFDLFSPPAKMIVAIPASRPWYFYLKNEKGLFRPELHEFVENYFAELDRQAVLEKQAAEFVVVDASGPS